MIYLMGGGGHAKVIAEILESCSIQIGGVFDKNLSNKLLDYQTLEFPEKFNHQKDQLIISIGDNHLRKKLATSINAVYATAVHPTSVISKRSKIGEGSVVMAQAVVNSSSIIGKHCIINTSASVDHDCVIGDFVHISPNSCLAGGVTVGDLSHLGAGCVIIPGIKIGKNVTIGAGSVVIKDIPDNAIAVGNPAKIIKTKI